MTTDCDINKLPKRSTDGAAVLDTSKYLVRMYATEGGAKYIKRTEGGEKAERQFRLYIGPLPVAYRCPPQATAEVQGKLVAETNP